MLTAKKFTRMCGDVLNPGSSKGVPNTFYAVEVDSNVVLLFNLCGQLRVSLIPPSSEELENAELIDFDPKTYEELLKDLKAEENGKKRHVFPAAKLTEEKFFQAFGANWTASDYPPENFESPVGEEKRPR